MLNDLGIIHLGTYLVGLFFIIVLPGPNSLFVLTTSAARGVLPGYQAACGVFLGDAILIGLTAAGAGGLLQTYPLLLYFLRAVGAAYLLYLGVQILYGLRRVPKSSTSVTYILGQHGFFQKALVLSLLNPKAILFLLSFFVQFVDPGAGHPWIAFMILGGFLQLFSLTYLSILIFGGAKLAATFRRYRRLSLIANSCVAFLFIGFAIRMFFEF